MSKILVLFTGGTIGSIKVKTGVVNGIDQYQIMTRAEARKRNYDCDNSQTLLIDKYNNTYNINKDITFEVKEIADVLSENMTISKWNEITEELRQLDFHKYDGVIITHGTDTLGYFSNYLSIILNAIEVPVILVSSNYELTDSRANGLYNFQAACDFINTKHLPGVFVTYRNTLSNEDKTRIIYGSRLLQCGSPSNDFESINANGNIPLATIDNNGLVEIVDQELYLKIVNKSKNSQERSSYINDFKSLNSKVLIIDPFVGIDYENYKIKNVNAVLHGLYHSGTACTDPNIINNIINFSKNVKNLGKDFFVGPFYGKDDKSIYATSSDMVDVGIKFVTNTSKENAYVKLLIAYTLASSYNIKDNQISEFVDKFMNEEINYEFIQSSLRNRI